VWVERVERVDKRQPWASPLRAHSDSAATAATRTETTRVAATLATTLLYKSLGKKKIGLVLALPLDVSRARGVCRARFDIEYIVRVHVQFPDPRELRLRVSINRDPRRALSSTRHARGRGRKRV